MRQETEALLFLSRPWIRQVAEVSETAKKNDPYFQELVSDLTMNVKYVVRDLPEELKEHYGGHDKIVFFVELKHGAVRHLHFGRKPANQKIHVEVAADYCTAKRLFLRECSPASVLMNRGVVAKPMGGFRNWRRVMNPRSIVTVSRVLRTARKVPTVLETH